MAEIAISAATKAAETMVEKAMMEAHYLCCYKSYVENFEEEQTNLSATASKVLNDIQEAKNKNENQIEPQVQLWLDKANGLMQEDIKEKKKWFGLVTDYFWQYKRGKELEGKTEMVKQLIEKSNFARVARSTGLPGINFYSSPNFMHFEDRKQKFEQLKEALKDDEKFMIGLHGMGGTGKTTMAIEVGKEVEGSKVFDKVIFSVVSKDANVKKIQNDIATHLGLPMVDGRDESDQAQNLWKRIAEGGEKVLIILDDVWKKLMLRDIGIPVGRHDKGCCTVLLTTRDWGVCREMECHETVKLEVLSDKDAVELFLFHAGKSIDGSNEFKDVALDIVKQCGRLPVAVIAVARALNSRHLKDWNEALERLQTYEPMHDVNEDLKEAYNSLRLSYENLKNERAKQLFLLCSLFPEDYEIPIELLSRIAIGQGLCGKANRYHTARSHFTPIINELIDSCLLKAEKECLKMHDLIHEVALWIGNKQIQAVMDSNTTLMESMQYSSWNVNNFPNHFDGSELEVLLAWINANPPMKVPDALFERMMNLKVLALIGERRHSAISTPLLQPIQSLINIRTLLMESWNLGDISPLRNLKLLESFQLLGCSIIELPNEIRELEKLRLLELRSCLIEKNNALEVIGRCLQLEELYYVSNYHHVYEKLHQITTLPKFRRYHIKNHYFLGHYQVDFSTSRFFDSKGLKGVFSKEIFASLVAGAEILELEELDSETAWTNIIPDMVTTEQGGMKDLTRLCLESCSMIKCLVHTKHLQSGVAIFSKLVELRLKQVGVTKLCCGPYPSDFLKQLEKLRVKNCLELENILFDGKLELGNLKSIELDCCSIACLFHPSTAQSLKQLETLVIIYCSKLKYIIKQDKGSVEEICIMLPKLKFLRVEGCKELESILPICYCEDLPVLESMKIDRCEKLKYIFGQYQEEEEEGGLHQMGKEIILPSLKEMKISNAPKFVNIYPKCHLPLPTEVQKSSPITRDVTQAEDESHSSRLSWGPLCCFAPKSRATSSIPDPSDSKTTQVDPTAPQGSEEKCIYNSARRFFTPPLYPFNLRVMKIIGIKSNITSLFTVSIASSMFFLETLVVNDCEALEHIVTDEGDGDNHRKCGSIFPNLWEVVIVNCTLLESIFPASYSKSFVHLEYVGIERAHQLKHVFGKCYSDDYLPHQNQNVEIRLDLPALKILRLYDLPKMVSICSENYYVMALSLENIHLEECPQLPIEPFIDFSVGGWKRQDYLSISKGIGMRACNLRHVCLKKYGMDSIYDFKRFQMASPMNSSLETMSLWEFPELRNICVGPKSYLSFQRLFKLEIFECKQLKVIFPASIMRSLPNLRKIVVSKCEELERIIEDDEEEYEQNPTGSNHVCFPELCIIDVDHCQRLKCLFSMSKCGMLPKLMELKIEDAPELVQVFGWEQGPTQKVVIKDVLPKLFVVGLIDLPSLLSICPAIDFHTVKSRCVCGCPNVSLTSAETKLFEDFRWSRGWNDDEHIIGLENSWRIFEREALEEATEKAWTLPEQNNSSPNVANSEEASKDIGEKDSAIHKHNSSSPNLTEIEETGEASVKETSKSKEVVLADEVNHFVLSNIPSPLEESPQDECADKEARNERIMMVQQELVERGHYLHSNYSQSKPIYISSNTASSRIIKETIEPRIQGGSKFDEDIRANQIMNSEKEPPHDILVRKEAKSERIILDQPTLPNTGPEMHFNGSQNVNNLHKTTRGEENSTDSPSLVQYSWEVPMEGVVKLNVDGAWERVSNVAGCGGILRNSKGECLGGFIQNIGKGSSFHAKAWAWAMGLKFSWDLGVRKLVLETDAMEVIEAIKGPAGHDHPEKEVLNEIQTMCDRDWEVCIIHCRREGNRAADMLAKASLSCVQGFHPFKDSMPQEVEKIVLEEARVSSISTPQIDISTIPTNLISLQSRPSDISSNSTSLQEFHEKESPSDILRAPRGSISSSETTDRVHKQLAKPQKVEELAIECSSEERPNQTAVATSPIIDEMKDSALVTSLELDIYPLVSSISTRKKPQQVTSDAHTDPASSLSNPSDLSSKTISSQGQMMVKQTKTYSDSEIYDDYVNPKEIEKHDLVRLFRIMKEGADMEVDMPLTSKIAALEDDKVAEAFTDLESSLKMDLKQIANSKEHTLCLENALNFLSTHASDNEPPTHGLRSKIDSIHQEIQSILSSFKQVSPSLEIYNKLEEKEKLIDEKHSQSMQAAFPLVSEILHTEKCMAKLTKQISRLQTELNSNEKEFEEYKNKLSSLKKQEKTIAFDAIGLMEEYEAVKKDKSHMEDDQKEARQKLEMVENQWCSCVANLRKTTLSLGILKQKL